MSGLAVGLIGLALFFVLIAFRMQIGFALALVAPLGIWVLLTRDAALTKVGMTPFSVSSGYDLASLPLFLLMANIIFTAGLSSDLYNLVARWVGHWRGGLAVATVGGCAGFSAISSSSLVTAVSMGTVTLPEMKKYGYRDSLAVGSVCAGGTLGILIPPSGVLIMYGIITQQSIGALFMAGLVPGLLAALFYMISIVIQCRLKPELGPKGPRSSWRERWGAFGSCAEIIALVMLVLGGMMAGWFTPAESGAVGAFGAIVFCLIRRRLTWRGFISALETTIQTAGMLYGVMIGAMLFQYFTAVTGLPNLLGEWITGANIPPLMVILMIMVMYFAMGAFLESSSMMLLTVPIFAPVVDGLGFSLVWFGILVVRMMEVALLTPPIGMIVFNISQISGVPAPTAFKGVMPFLAADVFHLALIVLVPVVVLWLPGVTM